MTLISNKVWRNFGLQNKKLILACSGGSDSTALLHYLFKKMVNPKKNLIVCHFNHQIHNQANEHETFVKQICQKHSLTFYSQKEEIKKVATKAKINLENYARQRRYAFLENIRQSANASYILTAHHQDDQVETILINFIRGSGLIGLSGMPVLHEERKVLRPLIFTPKSKLEEFITKNNIAFCQDPTNEQTSYLRNAIRLLHLPRVAKRIKNYKHTVLSFSEFCREANFFCQNLLLKKLPTIKLDHKSQELLINKAQFLKLPQFLQSLYLYQLLKFLKFSCGQKELLNIINNVKQKKSGLKTNLKHGTVYIDNKNIAIATPLKQNKFTTIKIDLRKQPLPIIVNWHNQQIKVSINTPDLNQNKAGIISFNNKQITIRQIAAGDKLQSSDNKLKSLLIKKGIPQRHRQLLPIIVDEQNKILGIPGLITSRNADLTGETHCHFNLSLVDS